MLKRAQESFSAFYFQSPVGRNTSESGNILSHPTDSTPLGRPNELPSLYTPYRPSTSATHIAAAEVTVYQNVFEPAMAPPQASTDGTLRRDFPLGNQEPVGPFAQPCDCTHYGAYQPPSSGCFTSDNSFPQSELYTDNPAPCHTYHFSEKAGFGLPSGEPAFQNQNDLWTEYIGNFMQAPTHPQS